MYHRKLFLIFGNSTVILVNKRNFVKKFLDCDIKKKRNLEFFIKQSFMQKQKYLS